MQLFTIALGFACAIVAVLLFFLVSLLEGRPMLLKYLPLLGGGMLLMGAGNGLLWIAALGLMVEVGGYVLAVKWPAAKEPV